MRNILLSLKRSAICMILVILPLTGIAQTITVQGVVTDVDGDPLPGASVYIENTTRGTMTDFEGKYKINVGAKENLVFSYIGFLTATVYVNNRSTLDIKLQENTQQLQEIVVEVGYGTMRRSDVTGAVVSIDSRSIEQSVATTLDQVLQGRAAGLQMTMNSGVPGAGSSIQIRGVNSINSSNEPIYVVDGVIISGETGSNTSNAIADINPNDIESIEILKDASATAIYGSQAANGVIIITMKKGKEGIPKISFNAYYGYQQLQKKINMMKLPEYASHYNDRQLAFGYGSNRKDVFSNPETLGQGTDWQSAIFDGAPIQSYNLSVRGGNKVSNYSISAGYFNQDGITLGSGFKRYTLRLSSETNIRDWLRMGGTMNLSYTQQETSIAQWSIIGNALYQSPQVPLLNPDGTYGGPDSDFDSNLNDFTNPVAVADLTNRDNEKMGVRANVFLLVKPVKWFNFRTEFTTDGSIDNYMYFLPEYKFGSSTNAYATTRRDKTFNLYYGWKNIANLERTFNKKHRTSLMLGHEVTSSKRDYLSAQRTHGSNELKGIDAGDANYATNSGNGHTTRFVSLFGRLFYSYDNRYQLTATIRRDGSSRFATGYQWGTFPSAAVAWRISEESFFKPYKKVVDNLKLRASYGVVGNSSVSAYAYDSMVSYVQSIWGSSLKTANIPNELLTWETTHAWNLGLDINLFNNRVEFIFDTYIKNTNDLLMQLDLPGYVGTTGQGNASPPWYNIGELQNKGFEFTLNTVNIDNRKFRWESGLTFSLNRNKITAMNTETAFLDRTYQLGGVSSTVTRTMQGYPVSQFYGYNAIGRINSAADFLEDNGNGTSTVKIPTVSYKKGTVIDNNASNLASYTYIGDLIYEDINGDGIIDEQDRTMIGSPLPKFTFGFNNTFRYANFDLTLFLYGSVGNKVFNWLRRRIDDPRSSGNLRMATANYAKLGYLDGDETNTNVWNRYVLSGADDSMVRMGAVDANHNSAVSSRFVENGSYLRIQNISLGYTLPKKIITKMKIERLRVYTNLQNLHTFSNYQGYDPEVGSTQGQYSYSGQSMLMYGIDTGRVPSPRTYTFGIDLTF